MADTLLNDTNYGHAGTSVYVLGDGEWNFSKSEAQNQIKQVPALATKVVTSSTLYPMPHLSTTKTNVERISNKIFLDHPHLTAAVNLLPELAIVSAAISDAADAYDPLVGNLFSLGSTTSEDRWNDIRQIAAFPAGECGNILRLQMVTKERRGWGLDRDVWIEGPSLQEGDCGYWNEEAAPIRQICFAQSRARSNFLAVRLPIRTVIFHPFHGPHAPQALSPYFRFPQTLIGACPIIRIGLKETAGATHVDVAFNPYNQQQFGIVDDHQICRIWRIKHGRSGHADTLRKIAKGPIDPSKDSTVFEDDGWARILWIADHLLVLSSRRRLSLVSTVDGSFVYHSTPQAFPTRSSDWILDVQRHQSSEGCFVVLTSTRLVLMRASLLQTVEKDVKPTMRTFDVKTIASWTHYRGLEDLTLNCTTPARSGEEYFILLHSRLNDLVQVFTFQDAQSYTTPALRVSDPSHIELRIDSSKAQLQLCLESMQFSEMKSNPHTSSFGQRYLDMEYEFSRLFVIHSDLSIYETILYVKPLHISQQSWEHSNIEPFGWRTIRQPRRIVSTRDIVNENDDFVVSDGYGKSERRDIETISRTPVWTSESQRKALDYRRLYEALIRRDQEEEDMTTSIDVTTLAKNLKPMSVDARKLFFFPHATLLECAGRRIHISDIDEGSTSLQELQDPETEDGIVILERIASERVLNLGSDAQSSIASIYDRILQNWVAALPSNIPVFIRQRKERLVRQIAAEVVLSTSRVRYGYLQDQVPRPKAESEAEPERGATTTIYVLPSRPLESSQAYSSFPIPMSSQIPLPGQSQLLSSIPQTFAPRIQHDPMARLRRFLSMDRTAGKPINISSGVQQVLGHWQIGASPETYNWGEMEQAEAKQCEEDDEDSHKRREKAQRKMERQHKRQQRENEKYRSQASGQGIFGSQIPTSSAIQKAGRTNLGSTSFAGQVPQHSLSQSSQPSRAFDWRDTLGTMSSDRSGRHGGRTEKGKKKKVQMSEF